MYRTLIVNVYYEKGCNLLLIPKGDNIHVKSVDIYNGKCVCYWENKMIEFNALLSVIMQCSQPQTT